MIALWVYLLISSSIGIGFTWYLNRAYPMSWILAVPMALAITVIWPFIGYIAVRDGWFKVDRRQEQ